jgi:glycosyltransferase involved in cell wall biosynthesis
VPDLVSILIPAYNAEKWIKDTINSALSQTWHKKEIVIVNDGSLDKTFAIAKQYESKSVKVISQENKGASAARNKALEYAQGDYIQWLDADDLLAPNKIHEQMRVVDGDPNDETLYSSPYGTFYLHIEKSRFDPNALWKDLTPVDWIVSKFASGFWMNPAGWLVSRRLTEKAGPWDTRLCRDIDGEYFCRVVAASKSIKFVQEAKCYYRQSGFSQVSRNTSEDAYNSLLLATRLSIECLRSLEDSGRTRRSSLIFLQRKCQYFYPDHSDLLREANALAFELGGQLMPPSVGWKLEVMRRLFGWKMGKKVMTTGRRLKLAGAIKWDEMSYKFAQITKLGE